ncbi:hypothetical protein HDV01_003332 [Terramyces sp. JEL0728]|nr:hypothetical protein HDV01_003332 [Terramyces sp. JEL0728]
MSQNWECESICSADEMAVNSIPNDLEDGEEYAPIYHPYEKQSSPIRELSSDHDFGFNHDPPTDPTDPLDNEIAIDEFKDLPTPADTLKKIMDVALQIQTVFENYKKGVDNLKQEMHDHSAKLRSKMEEFDSNREKFNSKYDQFFN